MSARLLAVLALGLAAAGAAAALAWAAVAAGREGPEPPPADAPVSAAASVSPRAHHVGDRLVATLELTVDRASTSPDGLLVDARFRPYTRVGPVRVEREDAGRTTVVRYTYALHCLDRPCVGRAPAEELALPQAVVRYPSPLGQAVLLVDWPPLSLGARLRPDEVDAAAFRTPSGMRAEPGYRVAPALLGWLSASLAAALVLATGVLVARRLRAAAAPPPPAAERPAPAEPLAAALEALASAGAGSPEQRRAALDALARALEQAGLDGLAPRARRLAWGRAAPGPEDLELAAADLRRALDGGRGEEP